MATAILTKFCQVCLGIQEAYEFKNSRGEVYRRCKICHNKASNKWRNENPEKRKAICARTTAKRKASGAQKNAYLIRKFKLSLTDYNNLLIAQEFKCAICKKHQSEFNISLAVDHNHMTGKVRGLLCYSCNTMIGYAKDSKELLNEAMKYLGER